MAGIKTVLVNRVDYMALLPKDFDRVLAVHREGWIYIDSNWNNIKKSVTQKIDVSSLGESYTTFSNNSTPFITFSGSYSKYWIIRQFQKLADRYKPVKYKITYYSK